MSLPRNSGARERAMAYSQGVRAHKRGKDRTDCPYDVVADPARANAWDAGYAATQAEAEATAEPAALHDLVREAEKKRLG